MTKTEALERIRRAVESRCNQHGHIHPDDLRDVLQDVINELVDEHEERTDAGPEHP